MPLTSDLRTAVAHLAFVFCSLVWGSSFILLERVTHAFGPVESGIWRSLGGAAVVGAAWWLQCRDFRLSRRDWAHLLFLTIAVNVLPQVILPYVLAQGFGHSFFGTLVAPIPLLTILISIPMLGTWPTWRQLCGVLGGLVCLGLIVEDGFDRGMSLGLLALALVIPFSSAFSNTYIKWKLSHVPAAPLTTAMHAVAVSSLLLLLFSQPTMESLHLTGPAAPVVTPTVIVSLLALGLIGNGISTLVFIWMILKEGPLFAGMTTYVVPVLALLWGQFDHEAINSGQMIAIAGVLAMVALVQSGSRRPVAPPEPALAPQTLSLPEAVAEAIVSTPLFPEPQVMVAATYAESAFLDRVTSQPESQVA
ncbi:MAG: DMT family transporter [Planctomycetes bacterium]|nr:DMT family transporter [Planctomycetota bacterium]